MKIPKYIQDMMERAEFVLSYGEPGYTIAIRKTTPYTQVSTLKAEIERLEKWVKRMMPKDDLGVPTMIINRIPKKTHYANQYAIVTIYDPVMKQLEKYIPKSDK